MARAQINTVATMDSSGFRAGINQMKSQTQGFGQSLSGMKSMIAGAFAVGSVVAFGRSLLATADNLKTASNTFGISMQALLGVKAAMAESGIGAESFMRIFSKLNRAMQEAQGGAKTYVEAFEGMNISVAELEGIGGDRALELLSKKYVEAADKQAFLNDVSTAFGERIGPNLIEVFQRIGTGGLGRFTEEAADAAAGMEGLAALSDQMEYLANVLATGVSSAIGFLNHLKWTLIDVAFGWKSFGRAWRENSLDQSVPDPEGDLALLSEDAKRRVLEMRAKNAPKSVVAPEKTKEEIAEETERRKQAEAAWKRETAMIDKYRSSSDRLKYYSNEFDKLIKINRNRDWTKETHTRFRNLVDKINENQTSILETAERISQIEETGYLSRLKAVERVYYWEEKIKKLKEELEQGYWEDTNRRDDLDVKVEIAEAEEALKSAIEVAGKEAKRRKEIMEESLEKRSDIMSGKGLSTPERSRIDSIQAIGGIIGGVAGRGDQQARIAERNAERILKVNIEMSNYLQQIADNV